MRHMVTVISDLHFEEELSEVIALPNGDPAKEIHFERNVPAGAFQDMMQDIASMAEDNAVDELHLVLAGDVIDLHRTQLWFGSDSDLRPYVDCREVGSGSKLEIKLLSIFDGVISGDRVRASLEVFRLFAKGQYLNTSPQGSSICDFPCKTILHFIPGNHDRLANATPTLRARTRQILGMEASDDFFPHEIRFDDPPLLVRHGHEYDATNFSVDLSGTAIDTVIADEAYDQPTFGDFVTVMVASNLPFRFRQIYTDPRIATDDILTAIYLRILEFDDVRPQSAVVDFFLNTTVPAHLRTQFTDRSTWQRHIWKIITPVIIAVLEEVSREPYFLRWLTDFKKGWAVILLRLRPWRICGLPYALSRILGVLLGKLGGGQGPASYAAHEKTVFEGNTVFVAAGHTHQPQVAHLFTENGVKRYFSDTGTWRNAILTAGDKKSYGRVNATTYATFYGNELGEQSASSPDTYGFEYWTGFDQNWPVAGSDS
jgi:UDP-2,3-diacylglucosamine pyrophosphatase LpxH